MNKIKNAALAEEVRSAREGIDAWPQWMKQAAYFTSIGTIPDWAAREVVREVNASSDAPALGSDKKSFK